MLDRCIQILYDIFQKVYFMGGIGFPQDARRLKKSVVDARRPQKIGRRRQTPIRRR